MNVIPIQVTEEGVFIPKTYLHDAGEMEVEMTADYVIVRPKAQTLVQGDELKLLRDTLVKQWRYSFVGIGRTRNPNASVQVEEILEREADRRQGWSLDK